MLGDDFPNEPAEEMITYRRFFHFSARKLRNAKDSFDLLDQLAKSAVSSENDKLDDYLQKISENAFIDPLNNVLAKWKSEYLKSPNQTLHPTGVLLKVDEWKSLVDKIDLDSSLPQENKNQLQGLLRPDMRSYTHVIQAVASSIDERSHRKREENQNKLRFVDTLLERLIEQSKTDSLIQPNVLSFSAVMNAWTKMDGVKSVGYDISSPSMKVEELLQCMEQLHEEGQPNLQPNVVIYNILFKAWAKEGKVRKIEDTLQRMIRLEIPGVTPDSISYSTLLSAYAKLGTTEAADKADSLLDQMIELYSHGVDTAKPNVISFSNVIQCHSNLGNGEKAEEWLQRLKDLYNHQEDPDWKPDVAIYNAVVQSWVNSGKPDKAEEFLRNMVENKTGGNDNDFVPPNSRTFNIILSAWAKAGEAERAESVLMEMHKLYVEDDLDTCPTVVSYNTVLDSYAQKTNRLMNTGGRNSRARNRRSTKKNQENSDDQAEDAPWNRAEAILDHMIDLYRGGDLTVTPTARTWNTVINVCAKAGRTEQAEKILEKFTAFPTPTRDSAQTKEDMAPSVRTWNVLLSSCVTNCNTSKANHFWSQMRENRILPDIVSYNTLLNCYVRLPKRRKGAGKINAQKEVESIFQRLWNDSNVTPNHITYLAIVNFWINQGIPEKAESFILKMASASQQSDQDSHHKKCIAPNRNHFHYILTSWGEYKVPKNAEKLLLKMAELSDDHEFDLRPNTETYNRLLNCWAKSMKIQSGERAEVILREMEGLRNLGDEEAAPDIYSYNSVLNAWSNSGDPAALTRIDNLILEMILTGNPNLLPDSFSYGTWLKAIASCEESERKRRLEEVMKTMKIHNFEPNEFIRQKMQSLSASETK